MQFDEVAAAVRGIPYITPENARSLYDTVLNEGFTDLLELGFAHGVASCYMAAALDELGRGHLTAVDLEAARQWQQPAIEELLDRVGLRHLVSIVREQTGYNWFLHNQIRDRSVDGRCEPAYDFCIIDGPKNWTIDGAAFFMVDKLLRPNGMIVFDDVDWTYGRSGAGRSATDGVNHQALSTEELTTPQIREVVELLVMQHADYDSFVFTDSNWFSARKQPGADPMTRAVRYEYVTPPGNYLRKALHAARRRLGPG